MINSYGFRAQDKITAAATVKITKYLQDGGYKIQNVEKDPYYQNVDVDLIAYKCQFLYFNRYKLEIKADRYINKNFYAEYISNCNKNTPGCWFYTESDYLLYYFTQKNLMYVLPTLEVQAWTREHFDSLHMCTVGTKDSANRHLYDSKGLLIDIDEMAKDVKFDSYIL